MLKKISNQKRGQLNISFAWLFAIIVGATILVLVIFGTTRVIKTGGQEQQIVGAKGLSVLLNPLETGFESAVSTPLSTNVETRIYANCNEFGNFGEQRISLSEFSFNKWQTPSSEISFESKYIFSNSPYVEGKNFYLFSKPFEFPFKVADLIYLTSSEDKYCFENAPENIKKEIEQIKQPNLIVDCSGKEDYIRVCFNGGSKCDIEVNYQAKSVKKSGNSVYFESDSLMYATIFSNKEIYECQVQRLLKRTEELSLLYQEKGLLLIKEGCQKDLTEELMDFRTEITRIDSSSKLSNVESLIENIDDKNKKLDCSLW